MKKSLVFIIGLISLLAVVSCETETIVENKIISAVSDNDFEKAHNYLNKYSVEYNRTNKYGLLGIEDIRDNYYDLIQKVFSAEIRYLVEQNTENSWNRAFVLPLEVDNKSDDRQKKVQQALYQELFDYAILFENKEIENRVKQKMVD